MSGSWRMSQSWLMTAQSPEGSRISSVITGSSCGTPATSLGCESASGDQRKTSFAMSSRSPWLTVLSTAFSSAGSICGTSSGSLTQAGPTPRCADRCGSSRGLHLVGTVDDVCGDAAACEAAVVDAVEVVVVDVGGELALETFEAEVEVAGEGGPPAFLEDQPVQSFDVAVALRPAGADACDSHTVDGDRAAEALGAKLHPVVGEHALQSPAGCFQLARDPADQP